MCKQSLRIRVKRYQKWKNSHIFHSYLKILLGWLFGHLNSQLHDHRVCVWLPFVIWDEGCQSVGTGWENQSEKKRNIHSHCSHFHFEVSKTMDWHASIWNKMRRIKTNNAVREYLGGCMWRAPLEKINKLERINAGFGWQGIRMRGKLISTKIHKNQSAKMLCSPVHPPSLKATVWVSHHLHCHTPPCWCHVPTQGHGTGKDSRKSRRTPEREGVEVVNGMWKYTIWKKRRKNDYRFRLKHFVELRSEPTQLLQWACEFGRSGKREGERRGEMMTSHGNGGERGKKGREERGEGVRRSHWHQWKRQVMREGLSTDRIAPALFDAGTSKIWLRNWSHGCGDRSNGWAGAVWRRVCGVAVGFPYLRSNRFACFRKTSNWRISWERASFGVVAW